ncbi:BTAD domain-containing putative transcriptional regulator [Blastococcus sp. SYSU DS0510]
MAGGLHVQVLGPLRVTVAGVPVGPAGPLRRSLFALLALHAGEVVSTGALVDGLWGEHPPDSAAGILQTYVSAWRKALVAGGDMGEARITTVGRGYRLRLEERESDLLRFSALVQDARRLTAAGRPAEARHGLERALALCAGSVLSDLADRPFHSSAVRALEEHRDAVVETWAETVLGTGDDDDLPAVTAALHRLRDARPWRERSTALLMWALVRQGRQRDALGAYEETRRRLADELGVDPGTELQAMQTRVLRHEPALSAGAAGANRRRIAPRLDSFLGREDDVQEVCGLLDDARLVTLTGPGGSGKTRLAEEAAADYATRAGIDTTTVELAAVEDPALLPGAIAARLEVQPAETVADLVARLADRRLVLVLDNLEQIAGVGPVVAELLLGAPSVRVLATSREPLRAAGEQRYPVDPLPVPSATETDPGRLAATPSIALLLDRARAADRRLSLAGDDWRAVRDVVRALDGLPLAIEIVAPWLGSLGARGLLAELAHPLDLSGRRPDVDARHRTLRAAVSWSHDRLDLDQQRLLRRLSVMRGGGDLEAVRAIGGTDLDVPVRDVLLDLLERQLVQRVEPVEGSPRFRLLETVRQYAAERLAASGEEVATRLRAAEWYAAWAAELAARSEGPGSRGWVARAVADADNLRGAMETLEREGRAEDHLQLVVDSYALWWNASQEQEGGRRLERALSKAAPGAPARAMGLCHLVQLTGNVEFLRAEGLLVEAESLARAAGDELVRAYALLLLADIRNPCIDEAIGLATEAAAAAERHRAAPVRYAPTAPDVLVAVAADQLSWLWCLRSLPTAIKWQHRALDAVERKGDRPALAKVCAELGVRYLCVGDVPAATGFVDRAVRLLDGAATSTTEDFVPWAQAWLLHHTGRLHAAESVMRTSIEVARAGGRVLLLHFQSCCLVDLLAVQGRLEEAEVALQLAEQTHAASDDPVFVGRLRLRRARLSRLAGRRAEASELLREAEEGIDPSTVWPDHVTYLVESALLAGDDLARRAWLRRLEETAQRIGLHVFPWERRFLAAGLGAASSAGAALG